MTLPYSRLRRSIGAGATLAMTLLAATAMAALYSVTVNPKLNDLDIKIEPLPNDGVLAVKLTNNTDQKVRCNLEYLADPQLPTRTSVFIKPHKDTTSVLRATRHWQAVTVNVECDLAKK